jgi:peptidoglycan/xylan/chitin deacetylase (PgdA/CDA1 family)
MPPCCAGVDPRPTRRGVLATAAAAIVSPHTNSLAGLIEPKMRLPGAGGARPAIALTFDACPGRFDPRVAAALVQAEVPATVFISGPWMRHNPEALAFLLAHPDVFSLQNHGARHLTCVLGDRRVWGLAPAGDLLEVYAEVANGARLVAGATGRDPTWFRGAGAIYSPPALDLIRSMGFGVAAFSLNGDEGATASTAEAAARIGAARDGEVVISHINQPLRPSGAGVAEGILDLKQRGVRFVRLDTLRPGDVVYS